MYIMLMISVAILLAVAVSSLAMFLSMHAIDDREKNSPFECGFDPKSNARIPFSTRFFLLAVIFLVFDVEIVLLTPIPITYMSLNYSAILISAFVFTAILMLGLLHEWNEGSLSWSD